MYVGTCVCIYVYIYTYIYCFFCYLYAPTAEENINEQREKDKQNKINILNESCSISILAAADVSGRQDDASVPAEER